MFLSPLFVTYTLLPSGLTATPYGADPAATVAAVFADNSPPAATSYCERLLSRSLTTYRLLPSGLTAIPLASPPAATVAGVFGDSSPPAPTSNCETWLP